MPGTRVTYHSGHAHLRARAWSGGAVGRPEIRGMGEGRGRAPARGNAAGTADGPRAWAAGARALGPGGAGCEKLEGREAVRRAEREYVKAANCYAARIINQEAI